MINGCGNCANYVWGDNKTPLPRECIICTTTHVPNGQHPTPSHWKAKPQTNADRIRAMSDEELAALMFSPAEQQIQEMAAFAPIVCEIVESIVPAIECCVESMVSLYDEILQAYPDKRVVWLAFCHKRKKTQKKNRHRIERHFSEIVWLHNR